MNFDKQDREYIVTLSAAKGLLRWAERCFASLSMTILVLVVKVHYRGTTPRRSPCPVGMGAVAGIGGEPCGRPVKGMLTLTKWFLSRRGGGHYGRPIWL